MKDKIETTTLGGGCFWCLEAVYDEIEGVNNVVSGYAGGHVANPDYKMVTTGKTGHAEVVQITFDSNILSFREILEVFFIIHDPTTINRQGFDVGSQYRSAIFYHSEEQKKIALNFIEELENEKIWPNPIVTEVSALGDFYPAEDYHQDYYIRNPYQGYCQATISPKLTKFRKKFSSRLKIRNNL